MQGLSDSEVAARIARGEVNQSKITKTSTRSIFVKNIFTIFNLVNAILAILIFIVQSYRNALFIFIAFFNTAIAIFNEIRAKKTIDKLKIISEKPQTVIRNGQKISLKNSEIVKDDTIIYSAGSQITVDAKIIKNNIVVNESFITGESDNLTKSPSDLLRSGSFVVSGECIAIVTAVGEQSFVDHLVKSTAKIQKSESKLFGLMNSIVKYISFALIPIGILLFLNQFFGVDSTPEIAVTSTVAALISMIPEGLILLTSSVLALSTIRLSRQKVLVQDLYAIETLARVDTICLDKTGTLTSGKVNGVEKIRKDAKSIIKFFKDNQIDTKIISGDTPAIVKDIAKKVGLDDIKIIDLTDRTKSEINTLVTKYNVFTKVQPDQKRYIVSALKKAGRTVAMTGDGVNDVLAMKAADCSITIGDGTDAACRAAKLVLLDSNFSHIKSIIAEGRQTINNLERSTTLFLAKTVYAAVLSVLFVFIRSPYPFTPIEMTLLNVTCIGLPAFILALEPNHERVKNKFLSNIIHFSIPAGLTTIIDVIIITILAEILHLDHTLINSISCLTVFFTSLILIYAISRPLNHLRRALLIALILVIALTFAIPFIRNFFGLSLLTAETIPVVISLCLISLTLFLAFSKICTIIYSNVRDKEDHQSL